MAHEIERKYLVRTGLWQPAGPGVDYRQGYLSSAKERVVRVRIAGRDAFLTVKGETRGVTRLEFEYRIPLEDARTMLGALCERPFVEKTRHKEQYGGRTWEIDVFHGENEGLVLAEVELPDESAKLDLPPWAGPEVSSDPRYFNANLGVNPYSKWGNSHA